MSTARRLLARFLVLALASVASLPGAVPAGAGFDIRAFGAVGDGRTLNTMAINAAVAAAAEAGGGTVLVPAGRFLSGTIRLRSRVFLHLAPGAVIVGSTELSDYPYQPPPTPLDTPEFRRLLPVYADRVEYGRYALIRADDAEDVGVVGEGSIEGQGGHPNFNKDELVARGMSRQEAHYARPYALSFIRCRNVQVRGVTFRDLAFWCQHYLDCDGVLVSGITVDSQREHQNNDGIDIDGSRNVRVIGSKFIVGDDAICLKAAYRDCENITIADNVCRSRANAVKFGTASNGGFKNISISNLTIEQTACAGLAFEAVDGGTIDGVVVSNIVMRDVGAAIFIKLGDRGRRWMRPEDHRVGAIRNVSISNVVATVFTPWDARPLGSSITGFPGHYVENVRLSHVRIVSVREQPREATRAIATAPVPENETDYPEYSMFGELPAHGLFVRHVRGLVLDDVELTFADRDHRSALVCERVDDLEIRGLRTRTLPDAEPVVRLRDVTGAFLTGTRSPEGASVFLRVEGESRDIRVVGCDLASAREGVVHLRDGAASALPR